MLFIPYCNLLLLLLLLLLTSTTVKTSIIFESRFYTIYDASIVNDKNASYTNNEAETNIEKFYNGTIPEDNKNDNYGDLILDKNNGYYDWMTRDTLVNDLYDQNVVIKYQRNFPRSQPTNVQVLNFGRNRGFCHSATINREKREVTAEVLVKAGEAVRVLVEVYGMKNNS